MPVRAPVLDLINIVIITRVLQRFFIIR